VSAEEVIEVSCGCEVWFEEEDEAIGKRARSERCHDMWLFVFGVVMVGFVRRFPKGFAQWMM